MYKVLFAALLFVSFFACYSKRQYEPNYSAGDYVHSKKNKDIMASKEILITSFFVATSHIPDEIKTDIEFFEQGKSALSKEARKKIADFAADILASYEDYSITVEGHSDISEASSGENYIKLSEKRAENVKKVPNDPDVLEQEKMGLIYAKFKEITLENLADVKDRKTIKGYAVKFEDECGVSATRWG